MLESEKAESFSGTGLPCEQKDSALQTNFTSWLVRMSISISGAERRKGEVSERQKRLSRRADRIRGSRHLLRSRRRYRFYSDMQLQHEWLGAGADYLS